MKVLLVFPPVWMPDIPYLSTPVLKSYLQDRKINAQQLDLNLHFWRHFYSAQKIQLIHEKVSHAYNFLRSSNTLSTTKTELLLRLAAVRHLSVEQFTYEVQNRIIDAQFYRNLILFLSEYSNDFQDYISTDDVHSNGIQEYHDLLYRQISYSKFSENSSDLLRLVEDHHRNQYIKFSQKEALPIFKETCPDVLGITISANNQVVPAFSLAKVTKDAFPQTHVIIGGPWCTSLANQLAKSISRFPYIDSVGLFEGEEVLSELCYSLQNGRNTSEIANLITNKDGQFVEKKTSYKASPVPKSPPCFSDLELAHYDTPYCLPIQAAKGCYWAQCKFCSYPILEPQYRVMDVVGFVNQLQYLQNKYEATSFAFADAAVSPAFAREFSEIVRQRQISFKWSIFARLERAFSKELLGEMAQSGCAHISWGLESASPRVQKIIGKPVQLADVQRILQDANKVGIHNRILVMYGLPTETASDAQMTVEFIRQNINHIDSMSFNYYSPEKASPVNTFEIQHNVKVIHNESQDLSNSCDIERALSKEEAIRIRDLYINLSNKMIVSQKGIDIQSLQFGDAHTTTETITISQENETISQTLISAICKTNQGLRRCLFVK